MGFTHIQIQHLNCVIPLLSWDTAIPTTVTHNSLTLGKFNSHRDPKLSILMYLPHDDVKVDELTCQLYFGIVCLFDKDIPTPTLIDGWV